MVDLDAVPRTYDEAVRLLASWHAAGDEAVEFYEIPDPEGKVVRLIEVSDDFPPGSLDRRRPDGTFERVIPVYSFPPDVEFPFRHAYVQITSDEWRAALAGTLPFRDDWDASAAVRLEVEEEDGAAAG